MAGLLSIYMRSQGSVASRISQEEMERLRQEAAATARSVSDERTLARYLAADAFYPFWRFGNVTPDELTAAEQSAHRAIAIGERLDDVNLQSAALDALSGSAQARGAWLEARELAYRRLRLVDRLNMVEKVDAHSVVAWTTLTLGNLEEAERVAAQGLALIQPGQIPAWTLHLVAWRIIALSLLGRWDDALAMGERGRQLWAETGRTSAGYAIRGFMAVMDIARARQDPDLLDTYRQVIEDIVAPFAADSSFRRLLAYAVGDIDALQMGLALYPTGAFAQPERAERALSFCLDHQRPPDKETLRRIVEFTSAHGYLLLEAQGHRGLGLVSRDPAELTQALGLWQRAGALPYAARAHCERALITGGAAELAAGMKALEALGDIDQLSRYERVRVA